MEGTTWDQLAVLYREVSEVDLYTALCLGLQTVSSLERCPLCRVFFIDRFNCSGSVLLLVVAVCSQLCAAACLPAPAAHPVLVVQTARTQPELLL